METKTTRSEYTAQIEWREGLQYPCDLKIGATFNNPTPRRVKVAKRAAFAYIVALFSSILKGK